MARIKSISISEARPRLTHLVDDVSAGGEPCFIIANSEIKAVLLGIDDYNTLREQLEDLEDTVDILKAELEGEPTMTFEEHLEKTKAGKKVRVPA
jgi:prevent-host-death family protein